MPLRSLCSSVLFVYIDPKFIKYDQYHYIITGKHLLEKQVKLR